MTLKPGEIVLVRIGFHQAAGGKIRPALVLLDAGDADFVAAPITSQHRISAYDVPLAEWRRAGLNVPSTARIHKLSVLAKAEVIRTLGQLAPADQDSVIAALRSAFSFV